jgi:thiosulfate dehydrogenase
MNRSQQEYADLLAYVQTLPTASPVTEGGRLYDKWFKALGVEAPAGDHPLWATQTTNTRTDEDTWRCKECHGWDYKGKDGAYGSGSHFTGFPGLMDATKMSTADLTAWLDGGKNPDHDFSSYLSEAQVNMLVAFIQEGIEDRSPYVNDDKTVNGDSEHGKSLFLSTCARCHGEDGKKINFGDEAEPEFLGTVATENPWEFFHKGSFGQPGAPMPSGLNFGWTLQDIADVLAFVQSLPIK